MGKMVSSIKYAKNRSDENYSVAVVVLVALVAVVGSG